jgi:hypothetical protein
MAWRGCSVSRRPAVVAAGEALRGMVQQTHACHRQCSSRCVEVVRLGRSLERVVVSDDALPVRAAGIGGDVGVAVLTCQGVS